MGKSTRIEWTDHTFNPWNGCTRVSPAWDFCYSAMFSERKGWAKWGQGEPRKLMAPDYWKQPHPLSGKPVEAWVGRLQLLSSPSRPAS